MNDVLDEHHYVTVPIITVIIVIILTIAVIFAVVIARSIAKSKRQDQVTAHMGKQLDGLFEALSNKEEEGRGRRGPRKPTAPQPPQTETYSQPGPPSYAAAGRGRPGYSVTPQSPAGRPGYSLGAPLSLVAELQEHEASTAGHSLGMNVAGLLGEAAEMLGGFNIGRDQVATRNYPRGAPVAINMADMMERRYRRRRRRRRR
jgi:type II secretory pathway pseudopilin PulG